MTNQTVYLIQKDADGIAVASAPARHKAAIAAFKSVSFEETTREMYDLGEEYLETFDGQYAQAPSFPNWLKDVQADPTDQP